MRLLVTGASGFLGQYVVAEALRRGHTIRTVVRPAVDVSELPWHGHPRVSYVRVDLRSRRGLVEAIKDVDAVLHVAAKTSGDVYAQMEGSVVATENLLAALAEAGVTRLVAVSSFSVYDYRHKWSFSKLDESSRLESKPLDRDAYAISKLAQENLIREFADQHGWRLTVLRPGVIYGRGKTWNARLGAHGENLWLCYGGLARVPLTYVENCAEAIVLCAEKEEAAGQTFNVVDNHPPTQWGYMLRLSNYLSPRPIVVPIPWTFLRVFARLAVTANSLLLKNQARLPSILVPSRLHARFKPLRYPNRRLRDALDWTPRYSLEQALDRCHDTQHRMDFGESFLVTRGHDARPPRPPEKEPDAGS